MEAIKNWSEIHSERQQFCAAVEAGKDLHTPDAVDTRVLTGRLGRNVLAGSVATFIGMGVVASPAMAEASPSSGAAPAAEAGASKGKVKHVIEDGDTLWDVQKGHKSSQSIDEIAKNNGITNPHLVLPGQALEFVGENENKKKAPAPAAVIKGNQASTQAAPSRTTRKSPSRPSARPAATTKQPNPAKAKQPEKTEATVGQETKQNAVTTGESSPDTKHPAASQDVSPASSQVVEAAPAAAPGLPSVTGVLGLPSIIVEELIPPVIVPSTPNVPGGENKADSPSPAEPKGGLTAPVSPPVTLPGPEIIPQPAQPEKDPQTGSAPAPETAAAPAVHVLQSILEVEVLPEKIIPALTVTPATAAPAPEAARPSGSRVNVDIVKGMVSTREAKAGVEKHWPGVKQAFEKKGHTNDKLLLHIAATLNAETGFNPRPEDASGRAYDITVNPGLAKGLGNIHPGDGEKFKGRGWQITGRANYTAIGKILGVDLANNPELMNDPQIANDSLVVFFEMNGKIDKLSRALDREDLRTARRLYNGAYNGINVVNGSYAAGRRLLASAPPASAAPSVVAASAAPQLIPEAAAAPAIMPPIAIEADLPSVITNKIAPPGEVPVPLQAENTDDALEDLVPIVEEPVLPLDAEIVVTPEAPAPRVTAAPPAGAETITADGPKGPISLTKVPKVGYVNSSIAGPVKAMITDAKAAGVNLGGGSYRPHDRQKQLRLQNCGDLYDTPASKCSPPTAKPGKSMHESGLALDLTCNGALIRSRKNTCFVWLAMHADEYGLRNLPSEPWHWSVNGK